MIHKIALPITIILLTVLFIGNAEFLQSRLRIFDQSGHNFLMRGNLPIDNNTFQADQLKEGIKSLTKLKDFNLIVISMMNFMTPKETRNRYIQEKFFEKNPEYGTYKNYIVLGSFISAEDLPSWARDLIAPYYELISYDKLHRFTTQLNAYLENHEPTVVYVHCSAGVDRTGMVAGAYRMIYHQKTFLEVHQENIAILGDSHRKHMHFNCFNGLQWYCLKMGRQFEQCIL